jgi:hypothetical protein
MEFLKFYLLRKTKLIKKQNYLYPHQIIFNLELWCKKRWLIKLTDTYILSQMPPRLKIKITELLFEWMCFLRSKKPLTFHTECPPLFHMHFWQGSRAPAYFAAQCNNSLEQCVCVQGKYQISVRSSRRIPCC